MDGPNVRYDHFATLWITQSDADDGIWPIHLDPCDKLKTPNDQRTIAKIKRLIVKHGPEPKPKRGPKLVSRGFNKTLRRRMNGTVERR